MDLTYFMEKNMPILTKDADIKSVIDAIARRGTSAIIEHNSQPEGIITPKDILKLTGKPMRGFYVSITGIKKEDDFIRNVIYDEIASEMRKLNKITPIINLALHVDRYHEEGKRVKYSIRARLFTRKGSFFAQSHEWDITKAMRELLARFETEIIRKKERAKKQNVGRPAEN